MAAAVNTLSPRLQGVTTLKTLYPHLSATILHPGPPWANQPLNSAQSRALAALWHYEQRIGNPVNLSDREIEALAQQMTWAPTGIYHVTSPLIGFVSESMALWVVDDPTTGLRGYAPIHEGSGPTLRFGTPGPITLALQYWLTERFQPLMNTLLPDGIPLWPIVRTALLMGDDLHMRAQAASWLLAEEIYRRLAVSSLWHELTERDHQFLTRTIWTNPGAFLSIGMAMTEIYFQWWETHAPADFIIDFGANGREWGYRTAGSPTQWVTRLAPRPSCPNRHPLPISGDSFGLEIMGFGGRILPNAPALWEQLGPERPQAFIPDDYEPAMRESPIRLPHMPFELGTRLTELSRLNMVTGCLDAHDGFLGPGMVTWED
ncbi:hypothetical protein TPY_1341 [Sulfobacillus acidophilus TPY]|uniref:Uncharacterized protein n=1 Tax=Sulfobacillus acidophilus (strain ATCC 700253 / DSM 10332 / NAL) TaxID=679936 RepID=G8TUQ9_SULAD|nr:hypothetical protein TPY_1341 [Sulfobacillus acidophilus TPY]AEW05783.1 protein of unknown function DUF1116 [Sulfobacillus acidophilus DSM 10332]